MFVMSRKKKQPPTPVEPPPEAAAPPAPATRGKSTPATARKSAARKSSGTRKAAAGTAGDSASGLNGSPAPRRTRSRTRTSADAEATVPPVSPAPAPPASAPAPARPRLRDDAWLEPWFADLDRRAEKVREMEARLTQNGAVSLEQFALGHLYYGLHRTSGGWTFREWAPNATAILLTGDFCGWREDPAFALRRINDHGDWEIRLPPDALRRGMHYRLRMHWDGGQGDRIPAWTRRVVQDPQTLIFSAQVLDEPPYAWKHPAPDPTTRPPLIYEAHIGMAQEDGSVGTYRAFRENILPRIADAGYNTIQLMGILEHPYYGSFGYHVSSFFAPSSRFGTPDEFRELVDAAHGLGLSVIIDLIHSHAVKNEVEGLSRFDGSSWQYFHAGPRGDHPAWDSRCFDYGKPAVLHFLLSNCQYWLTEFRLDGFRLDGVTSMLYLDHGLGAGFHSYADYFHPGVDEDALTYLTLANRLIHRVNPKAITIAEDVSGMPGLASPESEGGAGFDYRLAMGVPDLWARLGSAARDEDWHVEEIFHELTSRRPEERVISYVESHDQAIVGGKSFIFRLLDAAIYTDMAIGIHNPVVDRGIALWKIARLLTLAAAGDGYLNFIGNEFGHPEWVDFPREGNNWSTHYARRQWSLRDNPALKYHALGDFDAEILKLLGTAEYFAGPPELLHSHVMHQLLAFRRHRFVFLVNFHPWNSPVDYPVPVPPGKYRLVLDTDEARFAGHARLRPRQEYLSRPVNGGHEILVYLPARSCLVLESESGTPAP